MDKQKNTHEYDDIINLPHPTSTKRPRMSMIDRAAQFSPFAALTGYDAAIQETARITDSKADMSEDMLLELDRRYQILVDRLKEKQEIVFKFFLADPLKSGGMYVSKQGIVKRIDDFERQIILCDGTQIPMDDVFSIEGEIFTQTNINR